MRWPRSKFKNVPIRAATARRGRTASALISTNRLFSAGRFVTDCELSTPLFRRFAHERGRTLRAHWRLRKPAKFLLGGSEFGRRDGGVVDGWQLLNGRKHISETLVAVGQR